MTNRYRGLRPNPEKLGVTLLEEGEVSRPVRIRAPEAVHAWLKGMSAGDLGKLLLEIMHAQASTAVSNTQSSDEENVESRGNLAPHSKKRLTGPQKNLISALRADSQLIKDHDGTFSLSHKDGTRDVIKWQTVTSLRDYLYQDGVEFKLTDSV